jgi:excisionase family DNA binding protein
MQNKQDTPSPSLLLTIPQAAKSLGISRAMVYSLIAKRKGPPVIRLGRSVRVSAASLQKWIEELEHEQQ